MLCGTDFSPAAKQAANVAAVMAQGLQAPLELLHVSVIPAYPPMLNDLQEEVKRLRARGATVQETLLDGNAGEELIKRAHPGSCRLVVVASPGKGIPERWLLGSVSERTAERATVPTLVVRDAAPFEAWTRGERPLKVFVAFNFTPTSETALHWVKELQSISPCEVIVGLVDFPPEQRTRLGGSGALPLTGNPPEIQAILERDLKARTSELLGPMAHRIQVETNWGPPEVRLAEMAMEAGADLIVVGSHQFSGFERLWHKSVSRGLLHRAAMSVAVVPMVTGKPRGTGIAQPVRRVLVTTDFSDLANHAIAHAYSLVRGGGKVRLVYVVHPHEGPGGEPLKDSPVPWFVEEHARHVQSCSGKLSALIPAEAAQLGILTEVEVIEHRDVAEAIFQAAERFAADVICLGTRGRSGWSKALLGSVTQKVLAQSLRPVLVVRPPAAE